MTWLRGWIGGLVALLAMPGLALAQERWELVEREGVTMAFMLAADNSASFSVRCLEGEELDIVFLVERERLDPELKSATEGLYLIVYADEDADFWWMETQLKGSGALVMAQFSGHEDVREIAATVSGALGTVHVGLARELPEDGDPVLYHEQHYPALGSTAATRGVLAACGL